MTSTKASSTEDIRTALADASLPDFGNPEYELTVTNFDPESHTETEYNAWPGDVIERHPPATDRSKYYVVIDLTDSELIYYIPDEGRYANYPRDFLEEDLAEGTIAYHPNVL